MTNIICDNNTVEYMTAAIAEYVNRPYIKISSGKVKKEMYEFDYLLLCNKICGKSHYNMQMKIIVETQEEYDAWIQQQQTFKNSLSSN